MAVAVAASNGVVGTVGTVGKAKRTRAKPAGRPVQRKAMVSAAPRLALWVTTGMGVGIPALTLSLTTVAGALATKGHGALSGAVLGVTATVLTVSLTHLAWAIGDITRSSKWASWALAIAVDLSIVLSEAVHVSAPGVCDTLSTSVMVAVTAASMALNVWAFLRHR